MVLHQRNKKKRTNAAADFAEFLANAMLEDDNVPQHVKNEVKAMNASKSICMTCSEFVEAAVLPKDSKKNAEYVSAFLDLCNAFISNTNNLINQINNTEKETNNVSE